MLHNREEPKVFRPSAQKSLFRIYSYVRAHPTTVGSDNQTTLLQMARFDNSNISYSSLFYLLNF
jgi:hypothetical protein